MASIAAVSQLELKSKQDQDELATVLKMNGNEVLTQELEYI